MRIQDIVLVRVPNPNLRLMLRMAKTLVRDAPSQTNAPIEAALARLVNHIERIEDALSRRLRQANPHIVARELEFDRAVDALWILLRTYLGLYAQAFGHPGLDSLSDMRKAKIGLAELRARAATAASIHEQLFAAEGTAFAKFSLPAQAETMAVLLRIIEQDGLAPGIEQVFNAHVLPALQVCQAEYEELVDARMRRHQGVAEDFRELRTRLRWLLGRYKSAVETLYDEDQPASEAVVEGALRALLMVSAHMTRAPIDGVDEELDAELVAEELEFPEFDAELEFDLEPEAELPAEVGA